MTITLSWWSYICINQIKKLYNYIYVIHTKQIVSFVSTESPNCTRCIWTISIKLFTVTANLVVSPTLDSNIYIWKEENRKYWNIFCQVMQLSCILKHNFLPFQKQANFIWIKKLINVHLEHSINTHKVIRNDMKSSGSYVWLFTHFFYIYLVF